MKKTIKVSMVLLLAFLFAFPVFAAGSADQDLMSSSGVMKPMYTAIASISAGLSINGAGLAECSGTVTPSSNSYTSYLTVSLQRQNGSTWQQVTSWSSSNTGFSGVVIAGYYYVSSGTYRVCSAAFIYSSGGVLLDSALIYSPVRTY